MLGSLTKFRSQAPPHWLNLVSQALTHARVWTTATLLGFLTGAISIAMVVALKDELSTGLHAGLTFLIPVSYCKSNDSVIV